MDTKASLEQVGMMSERTTKGRLSIKRQSLPESVAASLQERILNGEFNEGDQLFQEQIAAEYEVSRMPVREALRQLEAAGLVQIQTHKGAIVTALPVEQIGELFHLRGLLECDALKIAVPRMTPEALRHAEKLLVVLEEAYHQRDTRAWGVGNSEFHMSLYRPSDRPRTLALIEGLNVQTERYIRLQLTLSHALADAEREHRELLDLCRQGETAKAVAYLAKHIENARKQLVQEIARYRKAKRALD
ncbi:GntR family transcriptional regulator [Chelatococcus asaccharovorans]|nr:GntR family transcriptional regulator [Chelatococcus asaccharovorans]